MTQAMNFEIEDRKKIHIFNLPQTIDQFIIEIILAVDFEPSTPASCYFCANVFSSRCDFVAHFESHFVAGRCSDCKQQLITINGVEYILQVHLPSNCCKDTDRKTRRSKIKDGDELLGKAVVSDREPSKKARSRRLPKKRNNRKKDLRESVENIESPPVVLCESEAEAKVDVETVDGGDDDEMDIKIEIDGVTYSYGLEMGELDSQNSGEDSNKQALPEHREVNHDDLSKFPTYLIAGKSTGEKRLRQYQCDICNRYLLTKRTLLAHMNNKHIGDNTLRNHICDICGINCASSSNLKKHKLTHEECRFICNFCGRGFHGKHNMNEHINTHTGEMR